MGLLDILIQRSSRRSSWTIPLEGSITQPGERPKGWEVPSMKEGDSHILITRGEIDGTHVTTRFPKLPGSERRG